MKRIAFIATFLLAVTIAIGQKPQDKKPVPPLVFTLKLTPAGVDSLVYVIDQSNAPHPLVKNVTAGLMSQIQKQVLQYQQRLAADTTKATPKK